MYYVKCKYKLNYPSVWFVCRLHLITRISTLTLTSILIISSTSVLSTISRFIYLHANLGRRTLS